MTPYRQFSFAITMAISMAIVPQSGVRADEPVTYSEEFGAQVRQYLLDNPEVILEAIEGMEAKRLETEMATRIAPHYTALLSSGPDMRLGSPDAETVIIEFFDYRCQVCKAMLPVIEAFVTANPDVAVVKKHLPVISPGSERAARYVLASDMVYGSEKSKQLHEILYSTPAPMREEVFADAAETLELEHELIQAEIHSDAVSNIIDGNRDIAIELGLAGTPVFIGEQKFKVGAVNLDDLASLSDVD